MLKLHELAPSPNNTKVRMALRFKGVPFEAEAFPNLVRLIAPWNERLA